MSVALYPNRDYNRFSHCRHSSPYFTWSGIPDLSFLPNDSRNNSSSYHHVVRDATKCLILEIKPSKAKTSVASRDISTSANRIRRAQVELTLRVNDFTLAESPVTVKLRSLQILLFLFCYFCSTINREIGLFRPSFRNS